MHRLHVRVLAARLPLQVSKLFADTVAVLFFQGKPIGIKVTAIDRMKREIILHSKKITGRSDKGVTILLKI